MDYTRSKDHVVHTGTGNRMHDDTQPNTTVFSANDVNQVNWSLMEVIKAAGLEGKTFNPDDASSYHVLQNALKAQFAPIGSEPDVMTGATESSGGTSGLVPAPIAGDGNKFLAGDGTFKYVSGVPVGTIEYFATTTPPAGYLKADGAAVGRETYPDLFAAIGTAFGEGDGSTTFNLPDLIGRFAQGSNTPGLKIEAGLPNIEGDSKSANYGGIAEPTGAFFRTTSRSLVPVVQVTDDFSAAIDASRSNPIYGASDTVQPPALTLLPCIKAFDAATNPGLIDITGLANEVDGKLDKVIDSKPVRYVIDAYSDSTNWWRKWSDGWVEQGGQIPNISGGVRISLLIAMANNAYSLSATSRETGDNANIICYATTSTNTVLHLNAIMPNMSWSPATIKWEVKGQGAQS